MLGTAKNAESMILNIIPCVGSVHGYFSVTAPKRAVVPSEFCLNTDSSPAKKDAMTTERASPANGATFDEILK